jgi:hypothetical protein
MTPVPAIELQAVARVTHPPELMRPQRETQIRDLPEYRQEW